MIFNNNSAELKRLQDRVEQLETIIDVFCKAYYEENKERIDRWHHVHRMAFTGSYRDWDMAVINRHEYNQAKEEYEKSANRLLSAREGVCK